MKEAYAKVLSRNDTGETGAHMGGIVIPRKNCALISFFPNLDIEIFNPDMWITCTDPDGETWEMRYIYYNGKTFTPAKSTRNEYRLTHMTRFMSKWNLKEGDSVVFSATDEPNRYNIVIKKRGSIVDTINSKADSSPKMIVLRGWSRVC